MKYMILTYGSQRDYDAMAGRDSAYRPEDFEPMHAFMTELNKELEQSGELVETRGLAAPVHTRRLHTRDGVPAMTDGPYAETEEVLAGYWIVECESFDRATEIASKLNNCPAPGDMAEREFVDVRPIMDSAADIGW